MVRVPKAAGAVIDPGIRKIDPVIALPIGALNEIPTGLLPVLQTGGANGRRIARRSGFQTAEAIALLIVAVNATQTVPMNDT